MKVKVYMGKLLGLAEFDSGTGQGDVTIDPRQSDREMLDTGIHEPLHLLFPDSEESEIEEAARVIGKVLWKLGFRRTVKPELKFKRKRKKASKR